ncbi:MAG: M20/M25/M40 family metallo-hydrolase [Candidatus Bathyarchaeia archaeon]
MSAYEVQLLTDMLRHYSPSGGEAPLAEYLRRVLDGNNFEVHLDAAGNVIGSRGGGPATLLLCGHMDTVPGELDVHLDGDLLYGRGAVDAKASLASMIVAASNIPEPEGRIVIACLVDEEGDGKGVKQLLSDRIQADYAIFGEPSRSWNLTIGYKGSLRLLLECRTSTGHSSSPWLFENAIEKAFQYWEMIKRRRFEEERTESRFYSVTSCLTKISGGGSSSIIPSLCQAEIDIRTPPQLPPETVLERLRALVEEHSREDPQTMVTLNCIGMVPAYESETRSPLVKALTYAIRKVCGQTPTLLRKTGTGDMNELGSVMKIPMVSYGPGDSHLDHTDNEHVSVSEYLSAIKVYEEAIPRIFRLHCSKGSR